MQFWIDIVTRYQQGGIISLGIIAAIYAVLGLMNGYAEIVRTRFGWLIPFSALVLAVAVWLITKHDLMAAVLAPSSAVLAYMLGGLLYELGNRRQRRHGHIHQL